MVYFVHSKASSHHIKHVLYSVGLTSEPEEEEVVKGTWSGYLDPRLSPAKKAPGDITHSTSIIMACKPFHWEKDFPPGVNEDPVLEQKVKEKWGTILSTVVTR